MASSHNHLTATKTAPEASATPSPGASEIRTPLLLRIGTWNVHQFSNCHSEQTFEGISDLLIHSDLDVIGLQETSGVLLAELVNRLNNDINSRPSNTTSEYQLASKFGGTAIITRLKVVGGFQKYGNGRYSSCDVLLPSDNDVDDNVDVIDGDDEQQEKKQQTRLLDLAPEDVFSIGVLHLDHRKEDRRLEEIQTIVHDLKEKKKNNMQRCNPLFDFWLGDFNALTRIDYTNAEWNSIIKIRDQSHWEFPVSELTSLMTTPTGIDVVIKTSTAATAKKKKNKGKKSTSSKTTHTLQSLGLQDAYHSVPDSQNRYGPLGTSRFDTRIDYVFYNGEHLHSAGWNIVSCHHMDCKKLSDHNLVVATFQKT